MEEEYSQIKYARNFRYEVKWGPFTLKGDCYKAEETGPQSMRALRSLLESIGYDDSMIQEVIREMKSIRDGVR